MAYQDLPAINEGYADLIIQYNRTLPSVFESIPGSTFQIIDSNFAIVYVPLGGPNGVEVTSYSYNSIPKCYTYMNREYLNSAGILRLHTHPYLKLRGKNTAIAIIDSGIDYTHPAFLDGTKTRIAAIWDQSLPGDDRTEVPYGTEFNREQIQQALDSQNPWTIVPTTDTDEHGTFLSGIAAGSDLPVYDFTGAAPEATIIVVKLKQAKKYLKELFLIPSSAAALQENDIMMGIWYAAKKAQELDLPLSICVGLGSNMGAHMGGSPLAQYMNHVTHFSQNIICVAAGNEGNTRNHFMGTIKKQETQVAAELRVGEGETGFTVELWGISPGTYYLTIQSPTGELLPVSTTSLNTTQTLNFVFVETKIEVNYMPIERESGSTLFFMRFLQPAAGIWRFLVGGDRSPELTFHIWLPAAPFLSANTYFLQPSPYVTITNPGNAEGVMTITAYDNESDSLYLEASRGYSASGYVKPDLAAPGVNLLGPDTQGGFTPRSGTSISAAVAAGASALLFEWAITRGNAPYMNGTNAKNYFLRGAKRRDGLEYPNPDWGYGALDLYRIFEDLL